MPGHLHQEVVELIHNRYTVLETIDLVQYDCEINNLIKIISQYRDHVFNQDQRIVILHHDTDYYQSNSGPVEGNTMFNLFTLFGNFNIACEKILFVTNHYGIREEINRLAKVVCNSAPPMVIYTALWYDFPTTEDTSITAPTTDSINSLYCCLNGAQRQHRVLALCYLQEFDLIKHGIISYNFKNDTA